MKQIEAVISHVPDTDTRTLRRCEIGARVHQGDVYVIRVPANHPRGKPWGSRQVAVGTTIGQRHVAEGEGVDVFAGVTVDALLPLFSVEQRAECMGPVVVASGPWSLTHPEHAHHCLPAGTYQITYQWDAARMGRVVD